MTATGYRVLAIVGGLMIVLALFLGQQKITVGDVTCGSAFGSSIGQSSSAIYGSRTVADCGDQVSERRFVALGVGLVGGGLLAGGLYGIRRRENTAA